MFAHEFARWDGVTAPISWCRWVLSSAECVLDNDAMRALVARARAAGYPLPEPPHPLSIACPAGIPAALHEEVSTHYTTIEWRETYATSCRSFLDTTLPKLIALGPIDELRVVFFFDD